MTLSRCVFKNPIVEAGQDPWVIYHEGVYYLVQSSNGDEESITIGESKNITNLGQVPLQTIWHAPKSGMYSRQLWAPELHFIENKWYVYYSASDGLNLNHRIYVLQSSTASPYGPYRQLGKIYDPNADFWAIDGTILVQNNALYFLWSGWASTYAYFPQNIYIAPMSNPWTLSGPRILISEPQYSWEKSIAPINEGPQVLQRDDRVFIIYSANASWSPEYVLGQLINTDGQLLNPTSWQKTAMPVFQRNATDVYGPGHPSFVKSPDGKEDWIIYHAKKSADLGWARDIRTQPFTWHSDGTVAFGDPVPTNEYLYCPSGEINSSYNYNRNTNRKHLVSGVNIRRHKMAAKHVGKQLLDVISNIAQKKRASISPPKEIGDVYARFRAKRLDPAKTVFVMMSFDNDPVYLNIFSAIQVALKKHGFKAVLASTHTLHNNKHYNILTYIYGCAFGVAVFDRIKANHQNPNVAFEVGYSFAIGKEVCLLKDKSLTEIIGDLHGWIYHPFDVNNLISDVEKQINSWIKDHLLPKDKIKDIAFGQTVKERLEPNELDFFILPVIANQVFSVEGAAETSGTEIEVYNSLGQRVAPNYIGNGIFNRNYIDNTFYGGNWKIECPQDDNYIILVCNGMGNYHFVTSEGPFGEYHGTIHIGETKSGQLQQFEFHRWKADFSSALNKTIVIELEAPSQVTWLQLFKPDGVELEKIEAKVNTNYKHVAQIFFDVQDVRSHMISVLNCVGAYKLTVQIV